MSCKFKVLYRIREIAMKVFTVISMVFVQYVLEQLSLNVIKELVSFRMILILLVGNKNIKE